MDRYEVRMGVVLGFGRKFSERPYWFVVRLVPKGQAEEKIGRDMPTKAEAETLKESLEAQGED